MSLSGAACDLPTEPPGGSAERSASSRHESPMQRLLRELPYPPFWRTASDCSWKFTAKVDAIKWVGGGNADASKNGLHLPRGGGPREDSNSQHKCCRGGLPAFGIGVR